MTAPIDGSRSTVLRLMEQLVSDLERVRVSDRERAKLRDAATEMRARGTMPTAAALESIGLEPRLWSTFVVELLRGFDGRLNTRANREDAERLAAAVKKLLPKRGKPEERARALDERLVAFAERFLDRVEDTSWQAVGRSTGALGENVPLNELSVESLQSLGAAQLGTKSPDHALLDRINEEIDRKAAAHELRRAWMEPALRDALGDLRVGRVDFPTLRDFCSNYFTQEAVADTPRSLRRGPFHSERDRLSRLDPPKP